MNNLDQVMLQGIGGWFGEQLKAKNILNQNGANLVFVHGKDMARKVGLTEEEISHIMPYPGKTVVLVGSSPQDEQQNEAVPPPQAAPPSTAQKIGKYLIPLALAAGSGLAGYYFSQTDTPIQQQIEHQGEVGFTVK